jgi:hypothetical protein
MISAAFLLLKANRLSLRHLLPADLVGDENGLSEQRFEAPTTAATSFSLKRSAWLSCLLRAHDKMRAQQTRRVWPTISSFENWVMLTTVMHSMVGPMLRRDHGTARPGFTGYDQILFHHFDLLQ